MVAGEVLGVFGVLCVIASMLDDGRAATTNAFDLYDSWLSWGVGFTTLAFFLLCAQFCRLGNIWLDLSRATSETRGLRTKQQIETIDRGWRGLFGYLVIQLFALAFLGLGPSQTSAFGVNSLHIRPIELASGEILQANTPQLFIFISFLALSFLPLLVAFYIEARFEADQNEEKNIWRSDVVDALTFGITSLVVGGIVVLAWAAGGGLFSIEEEAGTIVTMLVMATFVIIIISPHISRHLLKQRELLKSAQIRHNSFLAVTAQQVEKSVGFFDSILVKLIAPLSGATQEGMPHFLLLAVVLPLSALGYVLPSPFGLFPILLAILIAISLGRRWAWVEEDRETASRLLSTSSAEVNIGFKNDLKDEALLAYASLFVLVPLALNQLQGMTGAFHFDQEYSTGDALFDWLRFFGAELAKAVPFVDWWEIYNIEVKTPYDTGEGSTVAAKHMTFAARAIVDMVIMAALFQAIGIWQRSRTQRKLYKNGHLDAFDPFTEISFFEHGIYFQKNNPKAKPSAEFKEIVKSHVLARRKLGLPESPYSQRRLSELINSDNRDLRGGAEWMIERYDVLVGTPLEQLVQLPNRWGIGEIPNKARYLNQLSKSKQRNRMVEFQQIIQDLIEGVRGDGEVVPKIELTSEHIGIIAKLMRQSRSFPEYQYCEILCIELLGVSGHQEASYALASLVLKQKHKDTQNESQKRLMEKAENYGLAFYEHVEMRIPVYNALRELGQIRMSKVNTGLGDITEVRLLSWMAQLSGDKSQKGRDHAYEQADLLEQALTTI